jgi:hypothetical protein
MSELVLPMEENTVELLQLYGDDVITSSYIASTPITINGINTPIRHVYLILVIHETRFMLEKNDRVELSIYSNRDYEDREELQITPCTLSTFLYNGIVWYRNKGKSLSYFWTEYDMIQNNCQQIVFGLLEANQWSKHKIERFNQEADYITDKMTEYISNQYKSLPLYTSILLVHAITKYATSFMRRNHSNKEHSDYVTSDCIHFHTYPNCTVKERYNKEELLHKL